MAIKSINRTANYNTNYYNYASKPAKISFKAEPQQDEFVFQNKAEKTVQEKEVPDDISRIRLAFDVLTDQQIEEINRTRKLPDNAKFVANGAGGYTICNNFFGLRAGTQTIPEGFEVKRDIFGFAVVVPKDTNGAFIRK